MNIPGSVSVTLGALKRYIITGVACLVAGFCLGLALPHCGQGKVSAPLASIDSEVATHEVKETAPVKALDKVELKKRHMIDGNTVASAQKEVLATATIRDDSGTLHAGAVLDTTSGETQIVGKRPFAEWLSRNELGIGYGWGEDGKEKAIRYAHTFGRMWDLYASAEARIESTDDDTTWSAMLWLNYRW